MIMRNILNLLYVVDTKIYDTKISENYYSPSLSTEANQNIYLYWVSNVSILNIYFVLL